jgi:signal transduction histidine kinase
MSTAAHVRRAGPAPAGAPAPAVLWTVAAAGVACAAGAVALAVTSDHQPEPGVQAALFAWIILTYTAAGLIAWWRRPETRFGLLMVATGLGTFLSVLSWSNHPGPFTVGQLLDLLPVALVLHVFLAFPTGRLEGTPERVIVYAAYAAAVGLQVVRMALGGFGPDNLLEVSDEPTATEQVFRVQLSLMSALCLAGVVLLLVRHRARSRAVRRPVALLVDVFALVLVMVAFLLMNAVLGEHGFEWIRRATLFVIGLAPVAFLAGVLDARLARSAVGDLFIVLRGNPSPAELQDALARALRDPTLTLAYWLPEFDAFADLDGRAVEMPSPGDERRAMTLIERDGERIAALLHSLALRDEPELLGAVSAAAGIALETSRLQVELRARLEELRASRVRVIQAGQRERQRLERNLHDGAQQRLVALSLELGMLEARVGEDPDLGPRIAVARREIATSLEELREIARGLHPAVVSGHGLAVALEQLAARAPVPVRLDVRLGERLPEALEVAAFYLVSESLANVGKHARAGAAAVEVRRDGGAVVIVITDDGVGGADPERGTGLRGLADRVEALDGRLRVWSPAGGGTRVRAEIPCGS